MRIKIFTLCLLLATSPKSYAEDKMSLSTYLQKIREQSLDLKIESATKSSTDAAAVGIDLPPPMIDFIEMQPDGSNSSHGFSISQTIPFPTKLSADYSARKSAAKAQGAAQNERHREILADAKILYISLWAAQEKLKLLEEKRQILRDHIKLAKSTARSDSFAKIHVLKAESDYDFLENEVEAETQSFREVQSRAASLINLNPETTKLIANEPTLSTLPKVTSIEQSPAAQAMRLQVDMLNARKREAYSTWLPDFNLRYKEMKENRMAPGYSEVMVGVSLPFVFFWQPYRAYSRAHAEALSAELNYEKTKRDFGADKANLLTRSESLKKQILTLNEKLIPRAEVRMKLVRNIAPRDMESLQDHRDTMEAFPNLKIQALELRLKYEQSLSSLEKYIGHGEPTHE